MYNIFKAFAAAQNWVFDYGRSDFHNLFDGLEDGKKLLFVDPIEINENRNDSGVVESVSYSGMFLLMVSSDVDEESYEYRKENCIDPLKEAELKSLEEHVVCDNEGTIEQWKLTEVINVFDWNADGWMITYKVTIDE